MTGFFAIVSLPTDETFIAMETTNEIQLCLNNVNNDDLAGFCYMNVCNLNRIYLLIYICKMFVMKPKRLGKREKLNMQIDKQKYIKW